MHNDINKAAEITILDRAIKARARRDRDGKKRRPVTDGLIEYAQEQTAIAAAAMEIARGEAQQAATNLRADIARDAQIIIELRAELEQVREATMVSEQDDAGAQA